MSTYIKMKKKFKSAKVSVKRSIVVVALLVSNSLFAQPIDMIQTLSDDWAHVNFELEGDAQEAAFSKLITTVNKLKSSAPEQAGIWTWSGIINSSFAGAKGGLGALSYAKQAKKDFEKAIELDPSALAGSAYTSLGVLYHKVPGWPIAFGDDDDAEQLLKKGLSTNPDGKISNFFYGEFLFDEGKYQLSKKHLLIAKQVPLRLNALIADKHRQVEIENLLAKVEKKIAKKGKR